MTDDTTASASGAEPRAFVLLKSRRRLARDMVRRIGALKIDPQVRGFRVSMVRHGKPSGTVQRIIGIRGPASIRKTDECKRTRSGIRENAVEHRHALGSDPDSLIASRKVRWPTSAASSRHWRCNPPAASFAQRFVGSGNSAGGTSLTLSPPLARSPVPYIDG